MPLDPPARIAILGAGPIGLEAALYARFLGYQVDVFERASDVAENVRDWGHVQMFSPFGMNASPLGVAAIEAQNAHWRSPADDDLLTGREFVSRYLELLARTDLVADCLHFGAAVIAVAREGFWKSQRTGQRGRACFRILTQSPDGKQQSWTSDAVFDTSGTYGNHPWMGPGGIPAVNESTLAPNIEYKVPDVLGGDRDQYVDKMTLVVGSGYSAATSVVALEQLSRQAPGTGFTWITCATGRQAGPIPVIPGDRLPARQRLAETANEIARDDQAPHVHLPTATIERLEYSPETSRFQVMLSNAIASELQVDRIIANIGYRPDNSIYRELQVHECYASEGPMKLAAALADSAGGDCLDQHAHGPQTLLNPEPNFFVLGSKSYGRGSTFLLSVGLEQIRDVFTMLAENPDLDLYRSISHQRKMAARET